MIFMKYYNDDELNLDLVYRVHVVSAKFEPLIEGELDDSDTICDNLINKIPDYYKTIYKKSKRLNLYGDCILDTDDHIFSLVISDNKTSNIDYDAFISALTKMKLHIMNNADVIKAIAINMENSNIWASMVSEVISTFNDSDLVIAVKY